MKVSEHLEILKDEIRPETQPSLFLPTKITNEIH